MDRAAVDAFLAVVDGVLDVDDELGRDAMRWRPPGAIPLPRSRHHVCGTPRDCRQCA